MKPVGVLYQSKTGCYTAFDKHFCKGMHHTSGASTIVHFHMSETEVWGSSSSSSSRSSSSGSSGGGGGSRAAAAVAVVVVVVVFFCSIIGPFWF